VLDAASRWCWSRSITALPVVDAISTSPLAISNDIRCEVVHSNVVHMDKCFTKVYIVIAVVDVCVAD
jgi:hypothetical protein